MSTPFYDLASLVVVPSGYKASKVYAQKPLTTDGQLAFSRASTATRVNASGALETVSSNVPRLDYTNSTCPKLLLEPQRVNRLTQSNNFSHADWSAVSFGTGSTTPVLTANYATSPFGSNDAWRLQATVGSSGYSLLQQAPFISGQHTVSIWVKSNTSSNQSVYFRASTNEVPKTVTPTWTRISVTEINGDYLTIGLRDIAGQTNVSIDISIYAGQLENGAYPTSLIQTTTAAVTRLADACSKTGISSLIGQTEGTLFLELDIIAGTPVYHTLMQVYGDIDNRVAIGQDIDSTNVFLYINASGSASYQTTTTPAGHYKIALAYKNGDVAMYINGVSAITSTRSVSFGTALTTFFLNNVNGNEIGIFKDSQALLFKTRLTNAQLAELTTL